jgi:prophage antirepressor-like protein
VHLDEAVALMRALGYYPSQEQIKELCDEVAHETRGHQHHGEDDGESAHSISFEQV